MRLMVEYEVLEDFLMDYTSNVSIGGMFIRTDDPMAKGTKFRMRFQIPSHLQPVEANGEVCWVVPTTSGASHIQAGMGIRFSDIAAKDKRKIEALLRDWADHDDESEEGAALTPPTAR